jgi:C-terminal processing protease CtpA/Prc
VSGAILPRVASDEPASYLTLEPGADVFSSDGERIGTVEHVLRDEESDIFDGLVIDVRLGPGGLRFVDAPEVGEIREGGVVVAVAAADVDRLPKPSANPAVMEHHGVEDSEGKLEHKLKRAWEIVSGRG